MPLQLSREEIDQICVPLLSARDFSDEDLSDAERQVVRSFVARLSESFGSSSDFETDIRLAFSAAKQVMDVLSARALEPMEGDDELIPRASIVNELMEGARMQAILLKTLEQRLLCSPNVSDRWANAIREAVAALRDKCIAVWQDVFGGAVTLQERKSHP